MTASTAPVQQSTSTEIPLSCQDRRADAKAKTQLALADAYVRKAGSSNASRARMLMRRANTIRTIESEGARTRASKRTVFIA